MEMVFILLQYVIYIDFILFFLQYFQKKGIASHHDDYHELKFPSKAEEPMLSKFKF